MREEGQGGEKWRARREIRRQGRGFGRETERERQGEGRNRERSERREGGCAGVWEVC